MDEEKTYITPRQAAERLGVCRKTIFRMMDDGRLTKYKVGKKCVRIDEAEFTALMEQAKKDAEDEYA